MSLRKSFKIVQFRKNGRLGIEAVPEDWEIPKNDGSRNGTTYWPKSGLKTKIINPNSPREMHNVVITESVRKREGIATYADACMELDRMQDVSDTDHADDDDEILQNNNVTRQRTKQKIDALEYAHITVPEVLQENFYNSPLKGAQPCHYKNGDSVERNTPITQFVQSTQYTGQFLEVENSDGFSGQANTGGINTDEINPDGINTDEFIYVTVPESNSEAPNGQQFQILTSYFQKILSNQITIISGLNSVAKSVLKLESEVEAMRKAKSGEEIYKIGDENPSTSKKFEETISNHFVNIASEAEVKTLETLLENEEMVNTFKNHFKKIIGGRRPKTEAAKCAHEVLNKMFAKTFWLGCSWKGGSNEKNVKKFGMIKYENVLAAIINLIREVSDEEYPESCIQKAFESKMRNRHALCGKRNWAPKLRPTGISYKKYKQNGNNNEKNGNDPKDNDTGYDSKVVDPEANDTCLVDPETSDQIIQSNDMNTCEFSPVSEDSMNQLLKIR